MNLQIFNFEVKNYEISVCYVICIVTDIVSSVVGDLIKENCNWKCIGENWRTNCVIKKELYRSRNWN